MPLTVQSKRPPQDGAGLWNGMGKRSRKVIFEVDQTDAGSIEDAINVLLVAQGVGTDPVPELGDVWDYDNLTDLDCYCHEISFSRPDAANHPKRWRYTCDFSTLENSDPGVLGVAPLSWPVLYDIDWIEEQVPLEKARVVEALTHIGRAANSLGPITNSCGTEFTEGLLKTIYYPILIAVKNYATLDEIIALNLAYQDTTNNGTFFDASERKAKYLSTASGGRHEASGQVYYPGTTRIWFKQPTWDRPVLNNGWSHFLKDGGNYKLDANSKPKFFKNKVHDDPSATPGADPEADCSEPLNLALDGTLRASDLPALYLNFRDLEPANYAGIGIGS